MAQIVVAIVSVFHINPFLLGIKVLCYFIPHSISKGLDLSNDRLLLTSGQVLQAQRPKTGYLQTALNYNWLYPISQGGYI